LGRVEGRRGHGVMCEDNGIKAGRGFDAVAGWGGPIGSSLLLALGRSS
jgi:hypothetical protein